jgi:chromosome segregation ATPase
MPHDI